MITRSIALALLISVICLFVIGGPIANAMFQSPLGTPALPAATATIAPAALSPAISSIASKVIWVIFGAILATGLVLTFARRSSV